MAVAACRPLAACGCRRARTAAGRAVVRVSTTAVLARGMGVLVLARAAATIKGMVVLLCMR